MTNPNMTLRELRHRAKLTVAIVAEHMNVSVRTVYHWEDGDRPISAVDLSRLLALYGVDAPVSSVATLIPKTGVPHA